jgi:hypothetical protein
MSTPQAAPPAQVDTTVGVNVQPVRDAIEAMRIGKGSYDDLKQAVQGAQFAVRPTVRSEQDLADNWDYVALPDSFTDTVSAARWQKVLTAEQVGELQQMARFVGDAPTRDPRDQSEGN